MNMELFDAEEYFKNLSAKNKLCKKEDFKFCTCSGLENLEEAISSFRKEKSFFIFDDTTEGQEFKGRGGGYYHQRLFTISLMRRYRIDDMKDRTEQLAVCRSVFKQVVSRLLRDKENTAKLTYLKTDKILYREYGRYMFSGCTGLYFIVECSEPENLCYNAEEWEE